MDYFLTTERLGFRCWREEDLPLAMDLWLDPRVTVFTGGPFDADWVRARLTREMARMKANAMQYWPVFLLEDGRHVGCAGLQSYREDEGILELGYHLRPAFWGLGMAKEAAQAVVDYAFGVLGVGALFAGHDPRNAVSRRVLLSLGFVYAGEEIYPPTGMIEPTYRLRNPHNEAK
jgi:ribosomal-protein-alanine N-acetyltransferase